MNDEELLARLQAADPASASVAPPPDPHRLMEATMTVDTDMRTVQASPHRPRRRLALVAAAVLAVAGGIAWGTMDSSDDTPSALVLKAAGESGEAKCAGPTVDSLRDRATEQTAAFEGTVASVSGNQVTFKVDHWYTDGDASTVRVTNIEHWEDGVVFRAGDHGFIVAHNGSIGFCDNAFWTDPSLRGLFHRAFERRG
ncbi:hypothetical protein C6Y14_41390 [Streptomyces dioscori]|uniref:Uncharacterized protein n=1 Tax=Streptomyces dioscori TaxID=2109333 RepID=A0A2P8PUD8_9ACTN|nr:hypothetical protein [Streptomyces dioscori]PSM37616.1 hypothetical protein C6Y14_41390 [Streptomyces dioscori]